MWVQSLGQEDSREKEMASHSSILTWEIPWIEEPGGLQSMRLQRVGHDLMTKQQQNKQGLYKYGFDILKQIYVQNIIELDQVLFRA